MSFERHKQERLADEQAISSADRASTVERNSFEGLRGLTDRAKINLESHGRTLLSRWPAEAVDLLALAGALDKEDIVAALGAQFDRLEQSSSADDVRALSELSQKLIKVTRG